MGTTQILPGTLDMLILKALSLGPMHGYGVLLRLGDISGGQLDIQQGALYPALHRLEHRGLVESEWANSGTGRRARLYQLTGLGSRQLTEEISGWNALSAAINMALTARAAERTP